MLSDLQHHWPPTFPDASGVVAVTADPVIGIRSTFCFVEGTQRESLFQLHDGNWWTGCRFAVPPDEPSRTIRCSVLTNSGQSIFTGPWAQETGEWHLFPWPIPAAFAREHGLVLSVELAETVNPPVYLARHITFQQLPDMPRAHYMFVDDEGRAQCAWDGFQEVYACRDPEDGPPPQWNIPYILVPPMDYLLTGRPWSIERTYTPANWQTVANMDGSPDS
jgi:hypothetical protein